MRVEDDRLPATHSNTNKLSQHIRRPHIYSGMARKLTADFWGRQVAPLEQRAIANNHYFRGRGGGGGGGASAATGNEGNFDTHAFSQNGYQRLAEEGSNMSISSTMSVDSMGMSVEESSVGSNNSRTTILMHPDLRRRTMGGDAQVGHSVVRLRNSSSARIENCGKDALADSLMGAYSPTATTAMQGLQDYQDLTIDPHLLNLGPPFAQGAFGKLYRGTYQGQEVAVKILERPESDVERALIMEQQFAQEVRMLATLRHPNVICFVGCCTRPLAWCIVTEYAKGGSLRSFLAKRQNQAGIPLKMVVKRALDIARGMEYLHSLGFIHRDLKSDNLLIATDKSIKIADFGAARIEVQTEDMTPETGTYRWMAPEMIQHHTYSNKVDVYSFGIVLWELVTGNLPFQNMTPVQAAFAVVNKGLRPTIPPDCPSILAQIMTRCWDANPHERPSFSRVVKLLEEAETQIKTTVGTAIFRCGRCFARPLTFE